MKNYYNYKTYYTGSQTLFQECGVIYFCTSKDLGTLITLGNLDKIKDGILKQDKNQVYCFKQEDGTYKLSLRDLNLKMFSFDLIVYCDFMLSSTTSNSIRGYTIFSEPQRTYTSSGNSFGELIVGVTMVEDENKNEVILVEINNTLLVTKDIIDFRGTHKYNYPSLLEDLDIPEDSYIKYSNRIIDIKKDKTLGSITDTGFIFHDDGGELVNTKLFIYQGLDIDLELYSKFYIGTCGNDIVIFKLSLEDGSFEVGSLSKINIFKRPYTYYTGYLDLSVIEGCEFLYFAYSYAVFWNNYNQEYVVYFLEDITYSILGRDSDSIIYPVADKRNIGGYYKLFRDEDLMSLIKKTCVTPIENGNGINKTDFEFKEKLGSWWLLYKKNSRQYYYLSPYGCITSSSKLIQVNSRFFITEDNIFFAVEFAHSYNCISGFVFDMNSGLETGTKIDPSLTWGDLNSEQDCILDGIRRKPIRLSTCFPSQVLDSIFGLVLYIEDGLLYCY